MSAHARSQRRKALAAALGLLRAAPVLAGGCWLLRPAQARAPGYAAAAVPHPVSQTSRTVTTSDGVRLNLLQSAPPAQDGRAPRGETIVLVPGWCMPATIWRAQLQALSARWKTIAVDPRGQGRSEIPRGGYGADRRADDLHDVLAGEESVVLVAWSLGVLDALQYVHRHGSGRLRAMMLVDNSIGEPPAPRPTDFLARLRKDRGATMDAFVRSMFVRPRPEAELRAIRDAALRMPLESSIALLSYPLPREHWRQVVHGFDRPLAYVVTPRFREQSQNLQRARPDARVEVFEDCGHALFVDDPGRFNELLTAWIETLPRNQAPAAGTARRRLNQSSC